MKNTISFERAPLPDRITQTTLPETAVRMQRVAEELGIAGLTVTVLDPSDQAGVDEYIRNIQQGDSQNVAMGLEGSTIRTPEQIKKGVIDYAVEIGMALVAITRPETGDLADFWQHIYPDSSTK